AVRLVRSMNPGNIPRLGAATLDASAVAAALLLALVTSVAFGLAPALLLARTDAANRLRSFGQGRFTAPHGAGSGLAARGGLIVADVALAVVLITGAGLLVQSFRYMRSEDKGYSASALTLRLETAMTPRPSAARWGVMLHAAVERLAALPGVTAAGATDSLPLTGDTRLSTFQVTGFANRPNQQADLQYISGDYLQAVGTRLLQGRLVTTSDMPGSTSGTAPARSLAVVVSASFARTYFPDRDAVGGEVTRGDPHHPSRFHVVGVVEDVRHAGLDQPVRPTIYQPSWLADVAVVRSALPASRLVPEVRRALRDADGSLFLEDVQTMGQREGRDAAQRRFQTVLLSGFAIMAGALALIGLYGLLSYTVRRQIPEIGVRMALGASPAAIVAATVRRGAGLALAGGALGVVLALASNRLLAGLVYGISPVDPVTYILAPLAMLATAAAASWMPARRAARVDPVRALRRE
ncbi:MAG TPA: FtsX-like permease family protein, partial [Terriglobales bacterium]|nr:FtsX-like permease family protein [Terriglobales bacterium]